PGNSRIQKRDAQGIWSTVVIDQFFTPTALAVDGAGNLYAAAGDVLFWKRDDQENWSVIATYGPALGQVYALRALALDGAGNLYVGGGPDSRIQKRDAQGNWFLIATNNEAVLLGA